MKIDSKARMNFSTGESSTNIARSRAREPLRVAVIDGDHGIQEVHERIVQIVRERLRHRA